MIVLIHAGGKELDDFRDQMLNDKHIETLFDCITPDDIFPNTNIKGGVCYFLWNQSYNNEKDKTNVITLERGKAPIVMKRPLKVDGLDIVIQLVFYRKFSILIKIYLIIMFHHVDHLELMRI